MRKDDIEVYGGHPSVNVKCYAKWGLTDAIAERFHCSEETAEKALEYAWESETESFWESWTDKDELSYYFPGYQIEVYGEGRQGGHLTVHGLPDVDSWDAIMVSRWARFAKSIREDIDYRTSAETLGDAIEVNQWAVDGAERFNFLEVNGHTFTMPEVKAAEKAGRDALFNSR